MPSQVLTLILNSNHSKRATVLLPYDPAPDPLTWILTEARNKLNTKSLSRIFVRGGYELSTSSDSEDLDLAFNNEGTHREVWASKGEDYMGPPSAKKGRQDGGTAEVRVIARESHIDKKATKQLNAIRDLDGVRCVSPLECLGNIEILTFIL
jgi:release factor H-coupled RctB family protein